MGTTASNGAESRFAPDFFSADSAAARNGLGRAASAFPWLPSLLDAYVFLDQALEAELRRLGRRPVCKAGCDACCRQPIPVTPVELLGLRLAVSAGAVRVDKEAGGAEGVPDLSRPCPFLTDGVCSAYAVRPFACRRYLVFSHPCSLGEDPVAERPEDVHKPSEKALLHALRLTLPAYRQLGETVTGHEERNFFNRRTVLLQHIRW